MAGAFEVAANVLATVPFYARVASSLGGASPTDAFAALPLLTKRELRSALPKAWAPAGFDVRAALASGELEAVETAGTMGDRVRVLRRKGEAEAERVRALCMHPAGGCVRHAEYREAVLTRPATGMRTCHAGPLGYEERVAGATLLLNQKPDPAFWLPEEMDRMLDELDRHLAGAPATGLEGDATHLARLARHAKASGRAFPATLTFVALTHELATTNARRALAAVTSAPIFALHGSVETGPVLVETASRTFAAAPGVHVELLPTAAATPGAESVRMLVVTTLSRTAQPLLRYVLADLVQVDDRGAVVSLEGRFDDVLRRPDGALVTAGAIDRALAAVDGLAAYQFVQTTPTSVEASFVAERGANAELETATRAVAPLLEGLTLTTRFVPALAPEASGRFRSSKRTFPLDFAPLFVASEARTL